MTILSTHVSVCVNVELIKNSEASNHWLDASAYPMDRSQDAATPNVYMGTTTED